MASFSKPLRKIGIYTSGGDAPGMNAAIRSVARSALNAGLEIEGIIGGYSGILNEQFEPISSRAMANLIQRGGTYLKTGRCPEFQKVEVRKDAVIKLQRRGLDALVCIGGDGSFNGAHSLWNEHQFPIVGIPGTIDNDIFGTDATIGFDTAVNTALDAIDRIRDTASSHDRVFIVEVMGRDSGFIAANVGLAGGAEEILAPEYPMSVDRIVEKIKASIARGKKSSILVMAEGQKPGRAYDLSEQIRKKMNLEAKVCILGHQQRGGSPTAADRVLATRMGAFALQTLIQGHCDVYTALQGQTLIAVPLASALGQKKLVAKEIILLASQLAQ